MKILFTGRSGFVGTWLNNFLVSKGYNTDSIVHEDLLDYHTLYNKISIIKPDAIIHLAAQSSPHVSWKDPYLTVSNNVESSLNILHIAEELGIRLVVAGSAEVYGVIETALTEDSILCPRNPYGVSKLTLDFLIRQIAKERKINVSLLRLFNHIGPGQSDGFVVSTFSKQLAEIKLGLKEPTIHVGNLESQRDFIDVRDAIKAYELMLHKTEYGQYYNVCSGNAYKISWILEKLIEISELDVTVEEDPNRMRPSDIPIFVGDYSKIKKQGWKPKIPIEQTLKDTYDEWLYVLRK